MFFQSNRELDDFTLFSCEYMHKFLGLIHHASVLLMDSAAAAAALDSMLASPPAGVETFQLSQIENFIDAMGMDMVLLNATTMGYRRALLTCAQTDSIGVVVACAHMHLLDMSPKFRQFVVATTADLEYPSLNRMEAFEVIRDCTHLEMLHQKLEESVSTNEETSQAIEEIGVIVDRIAAFRGSLMRHFGCFTL